MSPFCDTGFRLHTANFACWTCRESVLRSNGEDINPAIPPAVAVIATVATMTRVAIVTEAVVVAVAAAKAVADVM